MKWGRFEHLLGQRLSSQHHDACADVRAFENWGLQNHSHVHVLSNSKGLEEEQQLQACKGCALSLRFLPAALR